MVVHAEQAASLMQAADQVRHDHIALPGAMRWLRRRVRLVRQALLVVIGLLPQHLAGCRAELTACRIPGTDRTRVAAGPCATGCIASAPAASMSGNPSRAPTAASRSGCLRPPSC